MFTYDTIHVKTSNNVHNIFGGGGKSSLSLVVMRIILLTE